MSGVNMNSKKVLLCESNRIEYINKSVAFTIGSLVLFVFAMTLMSFSGSTQARSLPDFTELVEKHSAAVVNISTTQKNRTSENLTHATRPARADS
jgi:S1-C subfamily serine protease